MALAVRRARGLGVPFKGLYRDILAYTKGREKDMETTTTSGVWGLGSGGLSGDSWSYDMSYRGYKSTYYVPPRP